MAVPVGAQEPAIPKLLNIVIVEGDGAIDNVRQRVSREPIVQVTDENNRPVAGAAVTFFLPTSGASGTFANGSNIFTAITGADGRASASGVKANAVKGNFQMRVSANYKGVSANNVIAMSNAAGAAIGATALWTLLILAGAGAAAGIAVGLNSGNGGGAGGTVGKPPVTITPGAPVVTPPR